jgi:hypothetical protein
MFYQEERHCCLQTNINKRGIFIQISAISRETLPSTEEVLSSTRRDIIHYQNVSTGGALSWQHSNIAEALSFSGETFNNIKTLSYGDISNRFVAIVYIKDYDTPPVFISKARRHCS